VVDGGNGDNIDGDSASDGEDDNIDGNIDGNIYSDSTSDGEDDNIDGNIYSDSDSDSDGDSDNVSEWTHDGVVYLVHVILQGGDAFDGLTVCVRVDKQADECNAFVWNNGTLEDAPLYGLCKDCGCIDGGDNNPDVFSACEC
jgi:hypothetical protein